MDSIDGQRVMAVLHDMLDSLNWTSYMTPPLLTAALESNTLPLGLRSLLMEHQQATERLASAAESGAPTDPAEVAISTREVCKELKREPLAVLDALRLGEERSQPLSFLTAVTQRLTETMKKRLGTTVEEEASRRQFHAEVARREEKASKELQSLEQQARIERRDRSRALLQLAEAERRARDELSVVRSQTVTVAERLAGEYKAAEDAERASFAEREAALFAAVSGLEGELTRVQAEAREAESALRSKKKSSQKEVADWVQEYDRDMTTKDKENRDNKAEYRGIKHKLRGYQAHYKSLQEEEERRAAEQARIAEEKAKQDTEQRQINEAAKRIQHAWRSHQKVKVADEGKATKKGKGGKGKTAKGTEKASKSPGKSKSKKK